MGLEEFLGDVCKTCGCKLTPPNQPYPSYYSFECTFPSYCPFYHASLSQRWGECRHGHIKVELGYN